MSSASVITLNNRITFSNCMEQQTKFLAQSGSENNTQNQINYSACRPSQCNCQSTPFSCISNICNPHQSCPETTHHSSQQQSPPSSSLFMHPLRPKYKASNSANTSMCLQQAKPRFQKTVEIAEMTNFGDKSNQEQSENAMDPMEEPKNQSQDQIENSYQEKQVTLNQQPFLESILDLSSYNEINTENVIDILQCNSFNQLKFSRDYSNRKQFVAWKLKIKDILLSKYQLFQIPKIQNSSHQAIKRKDKPKTKKQNRKTLGMRELSIRKLQKIVKKTTLCSTESQNRALKIISCLQQKNPISTLQFRRSLLKAFKDMNNVSYENQYLTSQTKKKHQFLLQQSKVNDDCQLSGGNSKETYSLINGKNID